MKVSLKKNYRCATCGRLAMYECDTTTNNDAEGFLTCCMRLCLEHLGSNPADNYHRCIPCSRIRGDEGYFVKGEKWEPVPIIEEEKDPF